MWSFGFGSGSGRAPPSAGGELCSRRVRKNDEELSLAGGESALERFDVALRGEVAFETKLVRREDGVSLDARGTTDMDE